MSNKQVINPILRHELAQTLWHTNRHMNSTVREYPNLREEVMGWYHRKNSEARKQAAFIQARHYGSSTRPTVHEPDAANVAVILAGI